MNSKGRKSVFPTSPSINGLLRGEVRRWRVVVEHEQAVPSQDAIVVMEGGGFGAMAVDPSSVAGL